MEVQNNKKNKSSTHQIIQPHSIASAQAFGNITVWRTYNFAQEWFNDACEEAKIQSDHNARRREIVFSVCFAESYLLEWVRDTVLKRDFKQLDDYFIPGDKKNVVWKWKEIPRRLKNNSLIKDLPDWGQAETKIIWDEWQKLVNYRNGLVHASSSRPQTDSKSKENQPIPSKDDLDILPAGWAIRTVVRLIRHVHYATETPTPTWLVDI